MAALSPRILISYRRGDTAGHAGRIYDRLKVALGRDMIFIDVDGIRPGRDFVQAITSAVDSCHVLLAVIGRDWVDIKDEHGKRRLEDPEDFVRLEVATALKRGILVIPVLVEGAGPPGAQDLPAELGALARILALEISDTRFDEDVDRLVRTIRDAEVDTGPESSDERSAAVQGALPSWRRLALPLAGLALLIGAWGLGTLIRARGVATPPLDREVMNLDEFIRVDAPSSSNAPEQIKTWLSEYLRSLRDVGHVPEPQRVIVVVKPNFRNAQFEGDQLVIGEALAKDRDVVLREYTHQMLLGPYFKQASDVRTTAEGRAIESGLADYLPASSLGDPKLGEVAGPAVANVPLIRNLINARRFDEISPSDPPQTAGEVWGGAFWDMRLVLGRSRTDRLLLSAWFGLTRPAPGTALSRHFVRQLLELASTSSDPGAAEQIRSIFAQRGLSV